MEEFSNNFPKSEWDLGMCDTTRHRIEIQPWSKPVKHPGLWMLLHYKDDLQKKTDVFLEKKLLTPSHSPYCAPAMLVTKKNGKRRILIDCHQLNRQIVKSIWPNPSTEQIFDTWAGSALFNSIDMSAGFYQVMKNLRRITRPSVHRLDLSSSYASQWD